MGENLKHISNKTKNMRTVKDVTEQYCPNGVISEAEHKTICIQYAKEAINEVVKEFWRRNNASFRIGGESVDIHIVSTDVMKKLK